MNPTFYPDFEVLDEQSKWDAATRDVVLARLEPPAEPRVLNAREVAVLRALVARLLEEERPELLDFIVGHIDGLLDQSPGEAQRKPDVPKQAELIRRGLAALDGAADLAHQRPYAECEPRAQFQLAAALQNGGLIVPEAWRDLPQGAFFKKVLSQAVDALASHPRIWSEMGYAGPAYPRGYYRIKKGLRDPWEARTNSRPPGAAQPGNDGGHSDGQA